MRCGLAPAAFVRVTAYNRPIGHLRANNPATRGLLSRSFGEERYEPRRNQGIVDAAGILRGGLVSFHRESNICLWKAIKSPSEILLDAAHLALLLARLRLDPQKFDSENASVFSAQDDR